MSMHCSQMLIPTLQVVCTILHIYVVRKNIIELLMFAPMNIYQNQLFLAIQSYKIEIN